MLIWRRKPKRKVDYLGYAEGVVTAIVAVIIVGLCSGLVINVLGGVVSLFTDSTSKFFIYLIPIGLVLAVVFFAINSISGRRETGDYE